MSASVVVSGASGFVGRHLCADLTSRGYQVEALVRRPGSAPGCVAEEHVVGDLASRPALRPLLSRAAAVVHCAGLAAAPKKEQKAPHERLDAANVQATVWLAEEAAAAGAGRFLFLSSAKVHGEHTAAGDAVSEAEIPRPQGLYAESKLDAERALVTLSVQRRLPLVVIRPPLLYGPGVSGNMLQLLRLVDSGIPLPFAAVDNRRSLLAIDNLCDFIAVALVNPAAAGETFLVSDQSAVSTTVMITAMADALRRPARLVHVPPAILHLLGTGGPLARARDRLFGSFLLDTSKAKTDLGWTAPVSFDKALERLARWYRDKVRG